MSNGDAEHEEIHALSIFEFVMVLVSIIIGLGIAEILNGVASQLRHRRTVRFYWVHSVFAMAIFLALIQQWWEIWGLSTATVWTIVGLLMMLGGPVGLYLIAHLLFPENLRGADLRDYYYGEMRPVWSLAAITVVMATLFRPVVFGDTLIAPENATSGLILAGALALAASRQGVLHAILVPTFLTLLVFDIFQWSFAMNQA